MRSGLVGTRLTDFHKAPNHTIRHTLVYFDVIHDASRSGIHWRGVRDTFMHAAVIHQARRCGLRLFEKRCVRSGHDRCHANRVDDEHGADKREDNDQPPVAKVRAASGRASRLKLSRIHGCSAPAPAACATVGGGHYHHAMRRAHTCLWPRRNINPPTIRATTKRTAIHQSESA